MVMEDSRRLANAFWRADLGSAELERIALAFSGRAPRHSVEVLFDLGLSEQMIDSYLRRWHWRSAASCDMRRRR